MTAPTSADAPPPWQSLKLSGNAAYSAGRTADALAAYSAALSADGVPALERATLHVDEGEFVCLGGPSGCGKSTLLNLIAGLEAPDSGSISSDGEPIRAPGRDRVLRRVVPEHAAAEGGPGRHVNHG